MTFGMEGPVVTGWWVNPKTGDTFEVVDTYFEDNKLLVKTADGRLLNYNQIQNYIQTNDPGTRKNIVERAKSQASRPSDRSMLPPEIANEIEGDSAMDSLLIPDDNIYGILKNGAATSELNLTPVNTNVVDPGDFPIIDRALNSKSFPKITGCVDWKKFPDKEISMLIDVMNVSKDDIIQYYFNHLSIEDIRKSIEQAIKSHIEEKLNPTKTKSK